MKNRKTTMIIYIIGVLVVICAVSTILYYGRLKATNEAVEDYVELESLEIEIESTVEELEESSIEQVEVEQSTVYLNEKEDLTLEELQQYYPYLTEDSEQIHVEQIRVIPIEDIDTDIHVILPESYLYDIANLPEALQEDVREYGDISAVSQIYYAAVTTYAADVIVEPTILGSPVEFVNYWSVVYRVNGVPMQFVYNDKDVYIREYKEFD